MKKFTLVAALASLSMLTAVTASAGDRTVTIDEIRKAVSNRLEQLEAPKEWYQVWVGIVPLTDYVRDGASQLKVFSDAEIKFSHGSFFQDQKLSTGEIITRIRFKVLVASFHMDVSMYLDAMTNNAVAFYFENRADQSLKRVRLEDFDSLLEQLTAEYYEDGHDPYGDQYHTALYCVVDGRKIDPEKSWFYAGNGTFEAHAARNIGTVGEKTAAGEDIWWPIHGTWFEEVPQWLYIPQINYVRDGTSTFWQYVRNRRFDNH